ncbi:hypothetical protein WJX72_011634 [[Myrmecia] bisecta]|uniref:FPL domain-containing protein n=1 Tax=[Myrmecia] bisecta TaxID=41462 RepID=A0AAW1QGH5_9CHLO
MAKRQTFWNTLLGYSAPRERFSLEELQYLRDVLVRNPVVTDANRETVVETLRSIAELMIWGDQHEPRFFDYFLEKNVLSHFHQILEQRANRRGDVAKQVLQTLSILIQNIRSETAIFYLFSNNHINDIVAMRFDFEDDEVLGYFINLLKTISLKLNSGTVQFFFHDDGERSAFPLYTEAVKFINHRDGMVRAAVRTLTLNVYSIGDPAVQSFVVSKPASNYFTELAIFIAEQCQVLDRLLSSLDTGTSTAAYNVDSSLADVEDLLSYCNDILCTGEKFLSSLLLQRLWESFAGPVLFWPLTMDSTPGAAEQLALPATETEQGMHRRIPSGERGRVRPLCALYVLERLLHVMSHAQFLNLLATALLMGSAHIPSVLLTDLPNGARTPRDPAMGPSAAPADAVEEASAAVVAGGGPWLSSGAGSRADSGASSTAGASTDSALGAALHLDPGLYRHSFLRILRGTDCALAAAAARVLVALLLNRSISADLLDAAGLLPHRRKKNRQLLEVLTAPATPATSRGPERGLFGGDDGVFGQRHRRTQSTGALTDLQPELGSSSTSSILASEPTLARATDCNGGSPGPGVDWQLGTSGDGRQGLQDGDSDADQPTCVAHPVSIPSSPASPASSRGGSDSSEWVDALCGLLLLQLLPISALWSIGWLLLQLLSQSKAGASLTPLQRQLLQQAAGSAASVVNEQFKGMWCDALPVLLEVEWARGRTSLLTPRVQSTNAAVQAWMQATQTAELGDSGPGNVPGGLAKPASLSAQAAKHVYHAAQRFVALAQIKQALSDGEIAAAPNLPVVTEAQLKAAEVREGAQLQLQERLACTVAFSRGQERSVYFALQGLPSSLLQPGNGDRAGSWVDSMNSIMASVPSVVLADPGTQLNTGVVLSVAPLMGADPVVDRSHSRWLHVHVRPPVRGLLKVLKASSVGNAFPNISRQLVDGHWVLSFPDADKAQHAKQLIDEHAAKLRALYCEALAPLLSAQAVRPTV